MNAELHFTNENGDLFDVMPKTKAECVEGLQALLEPKANTSDVNTALAAKANTNDVNVALSSKADISYVDNGLAPKANTSDVNTALAAKANSSVVSAISDQVSVNTTNIAAQTSRIDSITTLPSGSTSGDAELTDIRVMFNGKTAANAGGAVRTQVSDLINDTFKDFATVYGTMANKRLEPDGTYSDTQGYTAFNNPPNISNGDTICITFADRNHNLQDAEISYMFVSDSAVYPDTFNNGAGAHDPMGNCLIINVPASPAPITNIFMSFSSNVADVIKVFRIREADKIFYKGYGSSFEQRINNNFILMDDNIPSSLSALKDNAMYRINISRTVSWLPSSLADGNTYFIDCIVNRPYWANNTVFRVYTIYNNDFNPIYHKEIDGSGVEYDWRVINNDIVYAPIIMDDNAPQTITMLESNRYYRIQVTESLDWLPSGFPYDGNTRFIIRYRNTFSGGDYDTYVIYDNNMIPIYRKSVEAGVDYPWHDLVAEGEQGENTVCMNAAIIMDDSMPNSITDLRPDVYYRFQPTQAVSWLPSGFPYDGNTRFIIRYRNTFSDGEFNTYVIYDNNMIPIYRKSTENGTDYPWHDLTSAGSEKVIYVGPNETYTKITDALAFAYSTGDVKIILRKGTYDITNEIDLETAGAGPVIGNNTTLYCEEGAVVVCNYTGNNNSVKENFSPLNAGNGDFKIENLNIGCKNVRYCVHDELGSAAVQYKHEYINCDMYLDNSESSWDAPQCIGGGLGENGYIIIDGGRYDSLPADPECWSGAISYHNGYTAGCKSHIEIRNVYFKNSGARFGYYGASTQKTKVFVSNCRLSTNPVSRAETFDSVNNNMDVYAWNNEETNKVALYTENYSIYPRTITIPKSQFNIPASATLTGAAVHRNNYNVPLSASATVSGDDVVITISNNANADCVLYIFAIYE